LIFTGLKIFFTKQKAVEPDKNLLIRLLRRVFPITHELKDQKFFIRSRGRLYATPLLVGLVFLEATDIVFAVDSVPAIFALTKEPLIVFTSNVFAILGLRALYFMLAGAVDKFHLLKYGLGAVLVFVGLKMVWLDGLFGGKFPIGPSLGIIATVIAAAIVLSLVFPKRHTAIPVVGLHSKTALNRAASLQTETNHISRSKDGKMHAPAMANFLWKALGFYLLLMGLALILAAALR